MSPEIFFTMMMEKFVPIVLLCMVVGGALGLLVKMMKSAARDAAGVLAKRRQPRR